MPVQMPLQKGRQTEIPAKAPAKAAPTHAIDSHLQPDWRAPRTRGAETPVTRQPNKLQPLSMHHAHNHSLRPTTEAAAMVGRLGSGPMGLPR